MELYRIWPAPIQSKIFLYSYAFCISYNCAVIPSLTPPAATGGQKSCKFPENLIYSMTSHLSRKPMDLHDIVFRKKLVRPWEEGEKIPWNDPGFSARMLVEHLSQEHHAASRRTETIDRHVDWIHQYVLGGQAASVLDLGCGPGLYTSRLAGRGHTCTGIDFSPASINYARKIAMAENLNCTYHLMDLRQAPFGTGFDLVMFIYGEMNVFRPAEAQDILKKAYDCLSPDGILLLEPHTYAAVYGDGAYRSTWWSSAEGLFSATPHIVLYERWWDGSAETALDRYFILPADRGPITSYATSTQAYTEEGLQSILRAVGFTDIVPYPSLHGEADPTQDEFYALTARKSV